MGDTTLVVLAALLRFLGVEPQPKKVWYEGGFSKLFQLLGIMFNLEASPMTAHFLEAIHKPNGGGGGGGSAGAAPPCLPKQLVCGRHHTTMLCEVRPG